MPLPGRRSVGVGLSLQTFVSVCFTVLVVTGAVALQDGGPSTGAFPTPTGPSASSSDSGPGGTGEVSASPTPPSTSTVSTTPAAVRTSPAAVQTTPARRRQVPVPVQTTPAATRTTPAPVRTTPAPVQTTPAATRTTPPPPSTNRPPQFNTAKYGSPGSITLPDDNSWQACNCWEIWVITDGFVDPDGDRWEFYSTVNTQYARVTVIDCVSPNTPASSRPHKCIKYQMLRDYGFCYDDELAVRVWDPSGSQQSSNVVRFALRVRC